MPQSREDGAGLRGDLRNRSPDGEGRGSLDISARKEGDLSPKMGALEGGTDSPAVDSPSHNRSGQIGPQPEPLHEADQSEPQSGGQAGVTDNVVRAGKSAVSVGTGVSRKESQGLEARQLQGEQSDMDSNLSSMDVSSSDFESADDSEGLFFGRGSRNNFRSGLLRGIRAKNEFKIRQPPAYTFARWQLITYDGEVIYDTMSTENEEMPQKFTGGSLLTPSIQCCQQGNGWNVQGSGLSLFIQSRVEASWRGRLEPHWDLYAVSGEGRSLSRALLQSFRGPEIDRMQEFTRFETPSITPIDLCVDGWSKDLRGWMLNAHGLALYLRLSFYIPETELVMINPTGKVKLPEFIDRAVYTTDDDSAEFASAKNQVVPVVRGARVAADPYPQRQPGRGKKILRPSRLDHTFSDQPMERPPLAAATPEVEAIPEGQDVVPPQGQGAAPPKPSTSSHPA